LIDAIKGHHLWAERYDRELKDIFALQDEITMKVLTGVQVKFEGGILFGGDASRAQNYAEKFYKRKRGLDCYLKLVEAEGHREQMNIKDNKVARQLAEESLTICPENPEGYVILGLITLYDYRLGNTKSPQETLEKAIELAQKALALNDSMGGPHSLLGWIYICKKEYDRAIIEGERAVALNPTQHNDLQSYASFLTYGGRPEEAIPLFQKAIRLSPFGPAYEYANFGHALRMTGRFEEALSAFKKAIEIAPERVDVRLGLAATYSIMGLEKEARAEAMEIFRRNPNFSLTSYAKKLLYKEQSEIDKVVNACRKAGLK
jgi:adenylate cyclase